MRAEALHSSASVKRIHWILFNCADYNAHEGICRETTRLFWAEQTLAA